MSSSTYAAEFVRRYLKGPTDLGNELGRELF